MAHEGANGFHKIFGEALGALKHHGGQIGCWDWAAGTSAREGHLLAATMVWRKESHTDFFTSQERVPSQTHTPGSDVTCQSLYHVSIVSRLIPSRSRIYYMYRNNSQLHDGRDAPVTRGHTFAPHYHHSSYTGHCSLVAHWSVYSELAAAACRVVAREHSRQIVTLLRLTAACQSLETRPAPSTLPRLQTYSTYQTSFPHRLPTLHVLHSRPSESVIFRV